MGGSRDSGTGCALVGVSRQNFLPYVYSVLCQIKQVRSFLLCPPPPAPTLQFPVKYFFTTSHCLHLVLGISFHANIWPEPFIIKHTYLQPFRNGADFVLPEMIERLELDVRLFDLLVHVMYLLHEALGS